MHICQLDPNHSMLYEYTWHIRPTLSAKPKAQLPFVTCSRPGELYERRMTANQFIFKCLH